MIYDKLDFNNTFISFNYLIFFLNYSNVYQIKYINISWCKNINNSILNLVKFFIIFNSYYYMQLLEKCNHLESLILDGCSLINNLPYVKLYQLKKLSLGNFFKTNFLLFQDGVLELEVVIY